MKGKLTKAKYRTKKGCGCKLCKPFKGGHTDKHTVRDLKHSIGHEQQIREQDSD